MCLICQKKGDWCTEREVTKKIERHTSWCLKQLHFMCGEAHWCQGHYDASSDGSGLYVIQLLKHCLVSLLPEQDRNKPSLLQNIPLEHQTSPL